MNKRALQWLYGELPILISNGIITQTTADRLREYYGELNNTNKKSSGVILCSIAGTLLVGLGIVLLLAHNWVQLSRSLRVCLSLLPLVIGQATAFRALLKHSTSYILKESTATFVSLMVGTAIALVSQIYHIHGHIDVFILSWMLLIAPLTYLME